MAESTSANDIGFGLAIVFAALTGIGVLATTATSYAYALDGDHLMQLLSGVSFGAAVLFGGLAVAVLHLYAE